MQMQPTIALVSFVAFLHAGCSAAPQRALAHGASSRVETPVASDLERLIELSARDNRAVEHVRFLSKEIGHRLTGSPAYDESARWCLEQFRAYGLDARLEPFGEFPYPFERGVQRGRVVGGEVLELSTNAWTIGTQGVSRGPVAIEPSSEEELDALDAHSALKGRWILRARADVPAKLSRRLREAYVDAGILGVVRPGAKDGRIVVGGNHAQEPGKRLPYPDVRVRHDQFEALVASARSGTAFELEIELEHRFLEGPVTCHNVVADLRGERFPDEYVIVQGHLDTWDAAEGAQDNGTGVATTLEAARLLAASGARPARTIRFVLYGGEEQGLYGSKGYVRDHAAELERTSIVLNHDGGGTYLRGLEATEAMRADFERVCAPLATLDPARTFAIEAADGLRNSNDSDHAPFLSAGVPAFFWKQSEEGYERVHHTQYDTFENVPFDEVAHSARVVAITALGFANLERLVDRTDMQAAPPRRAGVRIGDDAIVESASADGLAAKAGWQKGDRVVEIDGRPIRSRDEFTRALQEGGGLKTVVIERAGERLETLLDWSEDPDEAVRIERARRRAERAVATGR